MGLPPVSSLFQILPILPLPKLFDPTPSCLKESLSRPPVFNLFSLPLLLFHSYLFLFLPLASPPSTQLTQFNSTNPLSSYSTPSNANFHILSIHISSPSIPSHPTFSHLFLSHPILSPPLLPLSHHPIAISPLTFLSPPPSKSILLPNTHSLLSPTLILVIYLPCNQPTRYISSTLQSSFLYFPSPLFYVIYSPFASHLLHSPSPSLPSHPIPLSSPSPQIPPPPPPPPQHLSIPHQKKPPTSPSPHHPPSLVFSPTLTHSLTASSYLDTPYLTPLQLTY
jgi:hypothetical protein